MSHRKIATPQIVVGGSAATTHSTLAGDNGAALAGMLTSGTIVSTNPLCMPTSHSPVTNILMTIATTTINTAGAITHSLYKFLKN